MLAAYHTKRTAGRRWHPSQRLRKVMGKTSQYASVGITVCLRLAPLPDVGAALPGRQDLSLRLAGPTGGSGQEVNVPVEGDTVPANSRAACRKKIARRIEPDLS
jgi:hypothetical protein